jgi:hypothetical protein
VREVYLYKIPEFVAAQLRDGRLGEDQVPDASPIEKLQSYLNWQSERDELEPKDDSGWAEILAAEEEEDEEEEAPPEIVAEAPIIYREGYPDLDGPLEGKLTVETTGLRFQFEDEDEFRISFKNLESILEPAKGDFSPKVKKKAMAAKLGGKAGKLAAGLVGRLWGGETAGKLAAGVGAGGCAIAKGSAVRRTSSGVLISRRSAGLGRFNTFW